MVALFHPKFNFERMKEFILSKTEDYHRFRKILVREFGIYWVSSIENEEEFRKNFNVVSLKENITSRESLVDFMNKEMLVLDYLG